MTATHHSVRGAAQHLGSILITVIVTLEEMVWFSTKTKNRRRGIDKVHDGLYTRVKSNKWNEIYEPIAIIAIEQLQGTLELFDLILVRVEKRLRYPLNVGINRFVSGASTTHFELLPDSCKDGVACSKDEVVNSKPSHKLIACCVVHVPHKLRFLQNIAHCLDTSDATT
jgi:hypothetical protein